MRRINTEDLKPLVGIALLVLAACEQPPTRPPAPAQPQLTTDFPSYAPGGPVTLRLANATARRFGYNLCNSQLERIDHPHAVRPIAEVCTAELRALEPGESATFTFRLPPDTRAGQYRVRTHIHDFQTGSRLTVRSNAFAVTPKGPRDDARGTTQVAPHKSGV